MVTFRKNDTLQCGQHPDVVEEIITFVEIEQPYCIPKGNLIICFIQKMQGYR